MEVVVEQLPASGPLSPAPLQQQPAPSMAPEVHIDLTSEACVSTAAAPEVQMQPAALSGHKRHASAVPVPAGGEASLVNNLLERLRDEGMPESAVRAAIGNVKAIQSRLWHTAVGVPDDGYTVPQELFTAVRHEAVRAVREEHGNTRHKSGPKGLMQRAQIGFQEAVRQAKSVILPSRSKPQGARQRKGTAQHGEASESRPAAGSGGSSAPPPPPPPPPLVWKRLRSTGWCSWPGTSTAALALRIMQGQGWLEGSRGRGSTVLGSLHPCFRTGAYTMCGGQLMGQMQWMSPTSAQLMALARALTGGWFQKQLWAGRHQRPPVQSALCALIISL